MTKSPLGKTLPMILGLQLIVGIIYLPVRSFLPVYFNEILSFPVTRVSLIMALGQFLAMMSSLTAGTLSGRVGRKRILIIGLVLLSSGPLLFLSGITFLAVLFAILFLTATSFLTQGGMGLLIADAEPARLGFFSALYHWGITLGGVIGGVSAGFLLDKWGYPALGSFLLLLSLGAGFFILSFLPSQHILPGTARNKSSQGQSYVQLMRDKKVLLIGLIRFLPTLYWGMANVLIPILLKEASGSNTMVALYGAVSSALATLAQILAGKGSDIKGSKKILLLCFILLILAVFGLSLFYQTVWGLFLFGSAAACAAWSLSTLMPGVIKDFVPSSDQDHVLAFVQTGWSGAMILGALGGGFLLELQGGLPFFTAALLNGIALWCLYALYTPKRGKPDKNREKNL